MPFLLGLIIKTTSTRIPFSDQLGVYVAMVNLTILWIAAHSFYAVRVAWMFLKIISFIFGLKLAKLIGYTVL